MRLTLPNLGKNFLAIHFLFTLAATALYAQPNNFCEDNDCPSAIRSVRLDAPLQGAITPERTEQFKTAYLQLKQIKAGQALAWKSRYEANELVGKSCLRFYQLEGHFAYEYERNPDFAQFISQQEAGTNAFLEKGLESSRRAMNLLQQMNRECPREIRQLNTTASPSTDDLPQVYMKLGQVLGYFSTAASEGPVAQAAGPGECEEAGLSKRSKRKQAKSLREKVDQLPIGPQQRNTINGIAAGLQAARPEQGRLNQSLESLEPRFSALMPQTGELRDKLEANEAALRDLQAFKPKAPKNDLSPQINALVEKRTGLAAKAESLADKAGKLKGQYDQIRQESNGLQNELDQRIAAGEQMQSKLEDLEKRKADLAAQLDEKPRKIKGQLDELTQQVMSLCREANELAEMIEAENRKKEEIREKLDELSKAEEEVADQLRQAEEAAGTLAGEQAQLEEEIEKLAWEVEQIRKEEATVDGLKEQLASLKSADALKGQIADCEEELKKQQVKLNGMQEAPERYQTELAGLSEMPSRVTGKLSGLKLLLNKLKLGYDGIPVTEKSLGKIEQLLEKARIMGSSAEILTEQQSRLQRQADGFAQNLEKAKVLYAAMAPNLAEMRNELAALSTERAGLQQQLNRGVADVEQAFSLVNDFLKRYSAFEEKSRCSEKELMGALEKEQAEIEAELKKLDAELDDLARYEEKLEAETAATDQEIKEHTRLMQELKQEEEAIKAEFGQEVILEAVSVEEWKEAEKVERGYWEASAVSDGELVAGFKGKYFEISLTDAEKKTKILFKPGRYYMSAKEFRTNYGATIGSFVNEALLYLNKADEGQVKLFIQGSADISGHNTFRGRLDPGFPYEEVAVLPLDSDKAHFLSEPQTLDIPPNSFTNDDLPNLRGRYLREIIGAYTTKFDPIVLEGVVQESEGEEKRNAVIYLFFPEELLAKY